MAMPIILFVDDEPNILKTLRRLFMDEDYDVQTTGSGQEALDLLEAGLRPTVIVSDQRMPEMGGAEFLAKASQLVPDSMRIVLTGYADINAAIMAINQGGIYRYIMKPWDDEELKRTVAAAINHANLVAENRALSQELAEKNQRLAEINQQLEVMVKARTQDLRQKVRELEGRDTIQQFLLCLHPVTDLLQTILAVVADVCQVQCAAYYAVSHDESDGEDEAERLALHVANGEDQPPWGEITIIDEIFTRLPALRASLGNDHKAIEVFSHQGLTISLTPVTTGNQFFGVIVGCRAQGQPFNEGELSALLGFAMQAAMGLKDCQVHEHYDDINSSLDDVLNEFK